MNPFFIYASLLALMGCHKTQVDADEVKATILNYEVGVVACSGGLRLKTETDQVYLAHEGALAAPYNDYIRVKLPALVWVRYQAPTGRCRQFPELIDIISIRER